jgi:acyl carrier protein
MATKVRGAWNLHEASRALSLDAFVLFSSAATLFAPPSQGAHAAACAAQDYIARYRHSLGLPALSIGWGLWAEVGQGAALQIDSRLERFQIRGMRPEIALDALERLMSQNIAHAYVVDTDWNRALPPKRHDAAPAPIDETGMQAQIVQRIARTLMTRIEVIDATRSLEQNGLDSIMTVELRERLTRELGIALPLIDFFREPSIESLSRRASAYLAESHAAQGAFT